MCNAEWTNSKIREELDEDAEVHVWSKTSKSSTKLMYWRNNKTDIRIEKIRGKYIVDHVNIKPLNDGWLKIATLAYSKF